MEQILTNYLTFFRSFFSKKTSASKDDNKVKKQLQSNKQEEEVSKAIPPPAVVTPPNKKIKLSEEGSPVFKLQRKRSRVLDSDTEEEEPEKENSNQTSVDESKETNGGSTACSEEKTPLCPNGVSEPASRSGVRRELVLSPVKSASPAASVSSSPLLKTPPKRQTGTS